MIGSSVSHYRILDQLGAGGMGVIYRARDERLERDVAIKVLPEDATTDREARIRFRTEALAISRLNHPNIATVYALEGDAGKDFLVMELVPGETLAVRLARGPLPEAETIEVGIQIADALAAAHEQGVIHRDLKPENVIVTPTGRAKVLDFGLAKLRGDDVPRAVTAAHTVIGTPGSIAPEQLAGHEADARTDLYALGVLLHQLASGRPPFEGRDLAALFYAIANATPAPLRSLRAEVSAAFERLVLELLDKTPARRPASARHTASRLRALRRAAAPAAVAAPARLRSIAVLPLVNTTRDPEREFFADGMTEAIITRLARVGALHVISLTTAMRYKHAGQPLPEIARELNVEAILEGSVLVAGPRMRVSVRLSDAVADRLLWAESYESGVEDVLAVQSDVAKSVAQEVQVQLTPREAAQLARRATLDPAAYEAYLRGRALWNRRTPAALRQSVELLERAVAIDPQYALAHAGLADAYNILGDINALQPHETAAKALESIARALELDPDLGEAYTSLGFERLFYEWDWAEARVAFERALEMAPGYATGHQWYSEFLSASGEHERAIEAAERARRLDPLSPILGTTLGDAYFYARYYEEAVAALRHTLELEPGFVHAFNDLGRTLTQLGRYDEGIAAFEQAAAIIGDSPGNVSGLGYASALAGRVDDARRALARLESESERRYVSSHTIASVHLALGEHDAALDRLERALRERDRALVWIRVHPRLDPLRGHPRFEAIAAAVTAKA